MLLPQEIIKSKPKSMFENSHTVYIHVYRYTLSVENNAFTLYRYIHQQQRKLIR